MTHTDHLEPTEVELCELLERTMSDAPVPLAMGLRALQDGRRLRTRRRIGMAAGAVAATSVAALILPAALSGGSPTTAPPGNKDASVATAPAPAPPPSAWPKGWWDQRAVDMVSTVEAIAPDGVAVTATGPLIDSAKGGPADGYIAPRLSGPTGVGELYVSLTPFPLPGDAPVLSNCSGCLDTGFNLPGGNDIACPENLATRAQCEELHTADGTVVGRRTTITSGAIIQLEVVMRRDGGSIYASATNTYAGWPQVGALSEAPPLTLDQLEALVRNDTWVRPAT